MIESPAVENLKLVSDMLVNQGLVKKNNEDAVDRWEPHDPVEIARSGCLYVLADGVGGTAQGEKASRHAVDRILHDYTSSTEDDLTERLVAAIDAANEEIFEHNSALTDERGMHTTVVACVVHADRLIGVNVGDSRAYLIRDGLLNQVSEDHTEVAKLLKEEEITREEAKNYPHKNRVLRVLGLDQHVQPHFFEGKLVQGDSIFLCSDGLSRYIDSGNITEDEVVRAATQMSPKEAVNYLVDRANECGGQDNISVIVVRIGRKAEPKTIGATSQDIVNHQKLPFVLVGVVLLVMLLVGISSAILFVDRGSNENVTQTLVGLAAPTSPVFAASTEGPAAQVAQPTYTPTSTPTMTNTPSPTATPTATPVPTITASPLQAKVKSDANLRFKPDKNSKSLAQLTTGQPVSALCWDTSRQFWIKVEVTLGGTKLTGYISHKLVDDPDDPTGVKLSHLNICPN